MKPNLLPYLIVCFFISVALSSCKDIFEPNLKGRQMQAEAPGNNYQTALYSINFWWNPLEDATSYRLQVVTPTFDSIANLVLDTVVKTTKFMINLSPGNYQWRVRAENSSSQSGYTEPRSFTIFLSSIKSQKVQLISPANNSLTAQPGVTFSWGSLYGATKYRLQIDTNNFTDQTQVVYDQVTPAQQINFSLPKDQIYQWRVQAQNDTAQAQWSVINTINYDHTPPPQVTLLSPANSQTINLPVNLQWNSAATAIKYKLYVFKSDGSTLYSNSFPVTQNGTSYSFNQGNTTEKIYWRVTALDAAGNESTDSETRSFTIQ